MVSKELVRAYYETHDDSLASVANIMGLNPRTVQNWAKKENWQQKSKALVPKQKLILSAKQELIDDITKQLSNIYELNMEDLEKLSQTISQEIMSQSSINGELAFGLAVAKMELTIKYKEDMVNKDTKAFGYAKDYVDMMIKVKNAIYGNNINVNSQSINLGIDLKSMSDDELFLIANQLEEEKND